MLRTLKHSFFALPAHFWRGTQGVLKKYRTPTLVALGIFVFFIVDWDLSVYRSFSEIGKQTKNAQSQEECCGFFNGPLVRGLDRAVVKTVEWVDRNHDFVTAASTFVIGVFTLTLWLTTRGLLRTSARQLDVAERALTDLERPYVFIDLDAPIYPEQFIYGRRLVVFTSPKYAIHYKFANRGRSPALLTELCARLVKGGRPDPIDPSLEKGDALPMGINLSGDRTYERTIDLIDADYKDETPVFLIGFVRYDDIFEKRHITGFCAR